MRLSSRFGPRLKGTRLSTTPCQNSHYGSLHHSIHCTLGVGARTRHGHSASTSSTQTNASSGSPSPRTAPSSTPSKSSHSSSTADELARENVAVFQLANLARNDGAASPRQHLNRDAQPDHTLDFSPKEPPPPRAIPTPPTTHSCVLSQMLSPKLLLIGLRALLAWEALDHRGRGFFAVGPIAETGYVRFWRCTDRMPRPGATVLSSYRSSGLLNCCIS